MGTSQNTRYGSRRQSYTRSIPPDPYFDPYPVILHDPYLWSIPLIHTPDPYPFLVEERLMLALRDRLRPGSSPPPPAGGMRSTGKVCWPSTLKSVHVPSAQSVNQRPPLRQGSGNAMKKIACVASARSIMQTPALHGNATCASCGMRKKIFQRNIASVNVVSIVCA